MNAQCMNCGRKQKASDLSTSPCDNCGEVGKLAPLVSAGGFDAGRCGVWIDGERLHPCVMPRDHGSHDHFWMKNPASVAQMKKVTG